MAKRTKQGLPEELSVSEVGLLFDLSRQRIRTLAREKKLRGRQAPGEGTRWVFPVESVAEAFNVSNEWLRDRWTQRIVS